MTDRDTHEARLASADRVLAGIRADMRADGRLSLDGAVRRSAEEVAVLGPACNLSDTGNAQRFVFQHGGDVRYLAPWRSWLVWDGVRWGRDDRQLVEGRAQATARTIWHEAELSPAKADRLVLAKWAHASEGAAHLRAMLQLAQAAAGVPILPDALDTHPFLFNCANGTLDLQTAQLGPHRREDLLTKSTTVAYDPAATCPRWLRFLDQIFASNAELIAYLRRAIGYSLTGDTREQCLHMLHGTGQNGKSTFLEVLSHVFGDYAVQADFATFLDRTSETGPRNDLARLAGARFVRASEVGEGKRLNEPLVKTLTGGDRIAARFLYAEAFEFLPTFHLWLAANHKPLIRGTDIAIWRRVRLVPFLVTIPAAQRDDRLTAMLCDEGPGILAWAVAGCLDWQTKRLTSAGAVDEATAGYRQDSDVIGAFLAECCELHPAFDVQASALYANYRRWAEEGGEFVLSQTAFGRRLDERGFGVRKQSVKYRCGLRLGSTVPYVSDS